MEAITTFAENMNKIFNVILHPIETLQGISYPICLMGAGIAIILGALGFDNCYKYAGLFIIVYILINMM